MLEEGIVEPWLPLVLPPDPYVMVVMSRIRDGAENEVRKDFTPSERVAILEALETNTHGGNRLSEQEQNIALGCDDAAKRAGFGNRETARQAKRVVEDGVLELVGSSAEFGSWSG